jgi:dedicator of cytokinesis protein 1
LATQYEEVTFEYPKLAELLSTMSKFYNNIMTELRPQPEYFRVAFYGRGFPAFLQNKVFIYRGRGFERLPDFQARMLDQVQNLDKVKANFCLYELF